MLPLSGAITAAAPTPAAPTPAAPTTAPEAAKALVEVPSGMIAVASMIALQQSMAGKTASTSDLLSPMLAKATPEQLSTAMAQAVDGAVAMDADLAARRPAMTQAIDAVTALYAGAKADTVQRDPQETLSLFANQLTAAARPLFEAAAQLDPTIQVPGAAS